MKRQSTNLQFFYQKGKLVTTNHNEQHRTIFRTADVPMAELQATAERKAGLLVTDDKCSVFTVQSEGKQENHSFTAYGHDPIMRYGNSLLGFVGEAIESITECYPLGNGYRCYAPLLQRFLSPDSLSPFGEGGLNAYTYCAGDPINFQDPTGHMHQSDPLSRLPRHNRLGPTAKLVAFKKALGTTRPPAGAQLRLQDPSTNKPMKGNITSPPLTTPKKTGAEPVTSVISAQAYPSKPGSSSHDNAKVMISSNRFKIKQIKDGAARMKRALTNTERGIIEDLNNQVKAAELSLSAESRGSINTSSEMRTGIRNADVLY